MWWRISISTIVCGIIGLISIMNSVYKLFLGNIVGTTLLFTIIGLVFVGPLWQVIHLIKTGGNKGETFKTSGKNN